MRTGRKSGRSSASHHRGPAKSEAKRQAQPRTQEKRCRKDDPSKNRSLAGSGFVADPLFSLGEISAGAGVKDAGPPGTHTARTSARSGIAVCVTGEAAVAEHNGALCSV